MDVLPSTCSSCFSLRFLLFLFNFKHIVMLGNAEELWKNLLLETSHPPMMYHPSSCQFVSIRNCVRVERKALPIECLARILLLLLSRREKLSSKRENFLLIVRHAMHISCYYQDSISSRFGNVSRDFLIKTLERDSHFSVEWRSDDFVNESQEAVSAGRELFNAQKSGRRGLRTPMKLTIFGNSIFQSSSSPIRRKKRSQCATRNRLL